MSTTSCRRCGQLCRGSLPSNPQARPFRRALEGLCANCVVTEMLKNTEPIAGILAGSGPSSLLVPFIQEQYGEILKAGDSELKLEEINWAWVVENWDLPLPKKGRKTSV